jgi:hypothetical protein
MPDKLLDTVNRFTSHFTKRLGEIESLKTPEPHPPEVFQCLLYASVLDTLAGSVLPKRRSNRDRFVYFIQRFCQWPDGERISLMHLVQLLRKNPDPAFEMLRKWALEEFRRLPVHAGQLMPISRDPSFDEVKSKWPVQKEHLTPLEGINLISLKHSHLLYAYRNTLVHELRRPGYGMEFGKDYTEPFYHHMSTLEDGKIGIESTVELVYPRRFLHRLCDTALVQLKQYFLANELNPYDSFVLGTYWIRELNR